jgi:hypothetical protein
MVFSRRSLVLAVAGVTTLALALPALAQDLHPSRRKSPIGTASAQIGDAYVLVAYGQPYKRDRDNIFGTKESGALVPYGERWRTGANEATEIAISKDLTVGGKKLAAGIYSISTIPGADKWTVHFNSQLGLDGLGHFDPKEQKFTPADLDKSDVLVAEAKVSAIPADQKEVDQFTISFEPTGASSADMVLRWIRTEVRVPVAR